jgi:hypothetical protein
LRVAGSVGLVSDRNDSDVADGGAVGASGVDRRPLSAWLLATWVAIAMVVLVPVVLVYSTPSDGQPVWAVALSVTTVSGLRYAWIIADGRRRLHEMSFWVFVYVFLGLAPLVQLRTEQNPGTTPRVDPALNMPAMVVVLVGIAAFCLGLAASMPGRKWSSGWTLSDRPHLARTVMLALFALAVDAYFISKVGVGTLLSSRGELLEVVDGIWAERAIAALISAVTTMSLLVAFIALVNLVRRQQTREWPLIALTVVVGLALVVTVNPLSSARYVFGTVALALAATFGLFATAKRFRVIAILWVVILIVAFPLADAFRYSSTAEFKSGSVVESLTSPDFDAFSQINNTLLYVENHGITNGNQAAGVLLFWVPRRFWQEKPSDTGILLSESRRYTFGNLSAPIWSELFINGGWVALVLGMAGLGWLVRTRDTSIEASLQRARAPGIIDCVLPFYLMILLRGSLLQAMSYLIIIVGSTLFVSRWTRVKSR